MPAAVDSQEAADDSQRGNTRAKLACTLCRANKVRCIRSAESSIACVRCSGFLNSKLTTDRNGLECVAPAVFKRKGRPPNALREARRLTGDANLLNPSDRPSMGYSLEAAQITSHTLGAQSLVELSHSESPSLSPNSRRKHNHNLNMAEYLDPADRVDQTRDPWFSNGPARRSARYSPEEESDTRARERDDPVSLHALSAVEASSLVALFHERMNPLVAVLDPHLHTMAYLRRTSSVLFSAVLASAARFFRLDLRSALLSHARTVLDRALQAGSTDIGVIQSLMILTYWKEPEDTSGWMKVGMALRLGYSLFWHVPRSAPLPADEMEARQLLNAERTWLCLFSFDRGQSYVHGLPTTMRLNHLRDPEIWAREHLYLGRSVDMHIAASIQLCQLKDHWGALGPDPAYLELAIETLTAQCDSLIMKWFNKEDPPPCFDQNVEQVLLWSILDFIFVMKRSRFEMSPDDPMRIDACLGVAARIADEIDNVAHNGALVIMQDSASCMTANLVDFARKVFRYCSRSQKSFVLTILHRVRVAHASVTNEDSKTAPAYVARFIRRVLSALSVESRAGSPGIDPTLLGGETAEQIDFFAELGLEEFMHVPEYVAQNEADDGRYWANMLLSEMLPG